MEREIVTPRTAPGAGAELERLGGPLVRLRQRLDELGLRQLLAAYGTEEERHAALAFDLLLLPEGLRAIVELFVLGQPVARHELEAGLPSPEIAALEQIGLLVAGPDDALSAAYRMAMHFGLYIFCDRKAPRAELYYGNDSLALGRLLLPARGRVLDLCAGVGTQGLLCATTAAQVVCVEKNPRVRGAFTLNALLNGLSERVELREGDLYEALAGERFDQVCCNPPLLPVPPGVEFPLPGHGGPDGLDVMVRVLRGLPEVLEPGGVCHLVGAVLGHEEGPDLPRLETVAREAGLDVQIILPARESLELGGRLLAALATTANAVNGGRDVTQAFLEHFEALGVDHLYSCLVSARRARSAGEVTTLPYYLRNTAFWSV